MTRAMKDSGLEWIGMIPENWTTSKIDNLYSLRNTKVSDRDYQPLSVTKQGIIPQLETAAKTDAHDDRKLVKIDDFVINSRSDRRGSCGISSLEGSVSLINTVLSSKSNISSRYYDWLFHTLQFGDEFYKWGHGIVDDLWTTNWQDMRNISIPFPPIDEQEEIATFLDFKCSQIDQLSANIKQQIEGLSEYKKALITQAVTKGLDPDVEMKDSGIKWVGNIPQKWEVSPLYVCFKERKNKNKEEQENNLLSLSYGKIVRKPIDILEGLLPESFSTYNIVEKGDIIIRPTDLQNDKKSLRTGLVQEHGIITSAYIDLYLTGIGDVRYYHYLLHAFDEAKVFYNMGNGVRQGLNYSTFSKLPILTPSLEDQSNIADYLDSKCSLIDALVQTKNEKLDTLQDYKKSLVFDYVTGKKEVPADFRKE